VSFVSTPSLPHLSFTVVKDVAEDVPPLTAHFLCSSTLNVITQETIRVASIF